MAELTMLPPCENCGHPAASHQRELRNRTPLYEQFRCHGHGAKCDHGCADYVEPVR